MNIEQIADELIARRPAKAKPWKRRRRPCLKHARPLSFDEICELKSLVLRRIESLSRLPPGDAPTEGTALCAGQPAGAPFCWKTNCPRCMPA